MKIKTTTIWRGRTANGKTYFHPRPAKLGNTNNCILMMTLQEISGSDYFHPVAQSFSDDGGESWSKPTDIPDFGRKEILDGITEGVCDVVPEHHSQTNTTLVLGHNVYYKNGKLYDSLGDHFQNSDSSIQRFPVYNVMNAQGKWMPERKQLLCDDFSECSIYSCGCSQKIVMPDGKLIIPITFGYYGRKDRMVTSLLCNFDGSEISVLKKGRTLELPVGRGLLEPSITRFENIHFMTIRAEDGHGYISTSPNGLDWTPLKQWSWENGEHLTMSTTQQHWFRQNGRLYLVYTRRTDENTGVFRWRSPLYIAEVNVSNLCLIKESEQTVFKLSGDGRNAPQNVPLMGNFHPLEISDKKGIITVGEMIPSKYYTGDTLLAFLE